MQTVKQVMRCMLEDRNLEKDTWPSILLETSYEINSMPNASIGYSPSRIMYGVEPRQLATSKLRLRNKLTHASIDDWCEESGKLRGDTLRETNENLKDARGKMKKFYDRGKSISDVETGDHVWLRNQPRLSGLDPCYMGPYQVTGHKGVDIELQVEGGRKLIHLNRCKTFKPSDRCRINNEFSPDGNHSPKGKAHDHTT